MFRVFNYNYLMMRTDIIIIIHLCDDCYYKFVLIMILVFGNWMEMNVYISKCMTDQDCCFTTHPSISVYEECRPFTIS